MDGWMDGWVDGWAGGGHSHFRIIVASMHVPINYGVKNLNSD